MHDIQVHSKASIQEVNIDKPFVVISIVSTDDNWLCPMLKNCLATLHMKFDDVDYSVGKYRPIDSLQAFNLVNFIKVYRHRVDTILIHCEAGISRSSAAAAAIATWLNGPQDSNRFFIGIGPNGRFCPNSKVFSTLFREFSKQLRA